MKAPAVSHSRLEAARRRERDPPREWAAQRKYLPRMRSGRRLKLGSTVRVTNGHDQAGDVYGSASAIRRWNKEHALLRAEELSQPPTRGSMGRRGSHRPFLP